MFVGYSIVIPADTGMTVCVGCRISCRSIPENKHVVNCCIVRPSYSDLPTAVNKDNDGGVDPENALPFDFRIMLLFICLSSARCKMWFEGCCHKQNKPGNFYLDVDMNLQLGGG